MFAKKIPGNSPGDLAGLRGVYREWYILDTSPPAVYVFRPDSACSYYTTLIGRDSQTEIVDIAHPGVHAKTARRRKLVGAVADEKDASFAKPLRHDGTAGPARHRPDLVVEFRAHGLEQPRLQAPG